MSIWTIDTNINMTSTVRENLFINIEKYFRKPAGHFRLPTSVWVYVYLGIIVSLLWEKKWERGKIPIQADKHTVVWPSRQSHLSILHMQSYKQASAKGIIGCLVARWTIPKKTCIKDQTPKTHWPFPGQLVTAGTFLDYKSTAWMLKTLAV